MTNRSPAALGMARKIIPPFKKKLAAEYQHRIREAASIIDAGNAELVKAVELFRDEGTILTACDRGACQQVVEKADKSDPQARLYNTLIKYTVEQ